jgi:hypothetical protein
LGKIFDANSGQCFEDFAGNEVITRGLAGQACRMDSSSTGRWPGG